MGWLISVAYTLPYMAAGILAACVALRNEGPAEKVAVGSGMGLFLMMWLPALASLAMGFTALAQAVALIPCLVFIVFAIKVMRSRSGGSPLKPSWDGLKACLLRERTALFVVAPLTALFLILLSSHSLMPDGSGNLTVGQSTYGDLSLHAGLITSISEQGAFPPMYSLVSGEVPVGYPFLCDSVSASPHTLGAGLREAYMVPMAFAAFAVFLCAFAFFRMWLRGGGRAAFATVTFFVGGGFGFAYFLDLYKADPSAPGKLQAMMEGFYTTPTNLVDKGVYWVNAIADLMIPQRATLFGWAVLIPCLYLLIKGLRVKGGAYLTIAGVMAGGLPLIHTHSF
ncbi:MAG: hypothetical protein FWE70_08075, partial [Oscillospiraceae bacterium]|nr:hypothetical protein [Oscillospiraceae bacterium]